MVDFILLVLHLAWMALAFFTVLNWRRLKDVQETPEVSIANVQPGVVASIRGRTAFHGAPRESLMGRVPAVWYSWSVARHTGGHERVGATGDVGWESVAGFSSVEPLALVDDAGNRILFFPMGAEVGHSDEGQWGADLLDTLSETTRDKILSGIGVITALAGMGALRFSERWLRPGVECFVIGRVDKPGPEHGAGIGPEVKGCVTEGGFRELLLEVGAPVSAAADLRRQMTTTAIGAVVMFILAVIGSILA